MVSGGSLVIGEGSRSKKGVTLGQELSEKENATEPFSAHARKDKERPRKDQSRFPLERSTWRSKGKEVTILRTEKGAASKRHLEGGTVSLGNLQSPIKKTTLNFCGGPLHYPGKKMLLGRWKEEKGKSKGKGKGGGPPRASRPVKGESLSRTWRGGGARRRVSRGGGLKLLMIDEIKGGKSGQE